MRRTIVVSESDAATLRRLASRADKPYLRERATAILKVAAGRSSHWVALHGLLTPRQPETVMSWVKRFLAEGVAGLTIRPGRGRPPAFSPSSPRRRGRRGGPAGARREFAAPAGKEPNAVDGGGDR